MATAICSCSFREAYSQDCQLMTNPTHHPPFKWSYLNGAEDPKDKTLHCRERSCANTNEEIDRDKSPNIGVVTTILIGFGPIFQPYVTA
jgi:hypothetical protein